MPKKIVVEGDAPNSRSTLRGKIRKNYQLSALYSKYFSLVAGSNESDSERIWLGCQAAAKCCLCPTTNYIQFTAGTTSNLRKHLKRKHPFALTEIEEQKESRRIHLNLDKNKTKSALKSLSRRPPKPCVPSADRKQSTKVAVDEVTSRTSTSVLDALTTFLIETMQPVSIVNEPSFINLLGLCNTSFKHCSDVWAVVDSINNRFQVMMERLVNELSSVSCVCVTADVWNPGKRSLIVVTAHWLRSDLSRRSAALACNDIKGSVTLEEVAHHLGNVITKCEMHKKLTGNLTINITNFTKAFDVSTQDDEDGDEEVDEMEEQGVATILPTESLTPESEAVNLYFPNHYHCLSRTLIVISSKDIRPALEFNLACDPPCNALNKSFELWHKLSVVKADGVTENADRNLKLPFTAKWNEFYRAVTCVNDLIRTETVEQVCAELDRPTLEPEEVAFLQEFELVLKPLVMATNHLNGDIEILLAHVLPTINGLKRKLTNLRERLEHCGQLADAILDSIEKRFGDCYKDSSLVIASCSHPSFRMRWITEAERPEAVSVLESVLEASGQTSVSNQMTDYAAEMEDFYGLECVEQSKTELQRYLEDTRTELESLDCYPAVKEIFRRYNTTIANRTPIDQLFRGDVNMFTRITKAGTKNFEMQLLLRANKHI